MHGDIKLGSVVFPYASAQVLACSRLHDHKWLDIVQKHLLGVVRTECVQSNGCGQETTSMEE